MATTKPFLEMRDLTGGRVGELKDWPRLASNLCHEALNVDFWEGALGRKRPGAVNVTLNGFSASGEITALYRHVPGTDETAAELWAGDNGALTTLQRLTGGTTWATVTLADAFGAASAVTNLVSVSFNGKLYTAYDSAVNRLHLWDGTSHRRAGLGRTGTPTATQAAGAATDVRKYKTAVTVQVSGLTTRRSELSAFSAEQDLAAQQATVTLVSAPGDGETHWELYAYSDDDDYATGYLIATTVIGTTTAVDNNATLEGDAPPDAGTNVTPPSCRYLVTDGNRLIMAGAHETSAANISQTTPKNNRVWFTPALGSSDVGDDERVSGGSGPINATEGVSLHYLDVDEAMTGLSQPIDGTFYVFSYRSCWAFIPTGDPEKPYQRLRLTGVPGCLRHHTIVVAEDENRRPLLAWLSPQGPYALGKGYLSPSPSGSSVQDIWESPINLAADFMHGVYYPVVRQIRWIVAEASGNNPNCRLVYQCDTGAWVKHNGGVSEARASCLFSATLGASMSRDLKPYIGKSGPLIWKTDTGTDDAGTDFQSYVKTLPMAPWGLGRMGGLPQDAVLIAEVATGVTITMTLDRDFGVETRTSTALLTASGSESRVMRKLEGSAMSEAMVLQVQLGDSAAFDGAWVLDALAWPVSEQGTR